MKKKLLPKVLVSLLVFLGIYLLIKPKNDSKLKELTIAEKREKFNNYLDKHPFNNRNLTPEEYEKIPKKDRPDLRAEQDFFMMVDPNTLEVPYEKVLTAFKSTSKRLKERKALINRYKQNKNFPKKGGSIFFEESSEDNIVNEAITVGGNPVVWKETGPDNVGGRTRAILWDPNDPTNRRVFAAGVTGGIWVNDNVLDPNSSWRAINDFLGSIAVNNIVADPTNPQVFYAGTGEGWFGGGMVRGIGVFKSVDGGYTWNLLSSTTGDEFSYIQKIAITSSGTVLLATRGTSFQSGGIYRSNNGGVSFTEVLDQSGADIEIASNGDIYASRGIFFTGSVYKSTNDGVDWTDVTPPGGTNPNRIEIAIAPSNANVIYAVAHNGSPSNSDNDTDWVQKSIDGGVTWSNLPIPTMNQFCGSTLNHITRGQAWYNLILAVSPTDPDVVILGGVDMAKSEDGGQTWRQISRWSNDSGACDGIPFVHADIHNIVFRPNHPAEALIGSDGGIDYSTNLSIAPAPTFEARDKNYTTSQFYSVATDNVSNSDYYIGGLQDNGTQQLRSDLNSSSVEVYPGDGAFAHVDQLDRTYQLVAAQFGNIGHSSNGGTSFSFVTSSGGNFINQSDYDNTAGILYSTANSNEIHRLNNVKSVNPSDDLIEINIGGRQTSALRANTNTANRIFVGTEGGLIFRIDDANATPTVTDITGNISTVGNVSSIDVGTTDDELIVTYSNFGVASVWLTTDGGATWVNKDDTGYGLPDIPIRWALFNPNNTQQVLLATELGVWSANDITATNPGWEPSNEGLANVRCDMLQYRDSDGIVVVATHGRGVFTTNIFAADDTTPPATVSFTPADEETEAAPLDADLEIEFDEPVRIGTGNVTLYLASNNSVVESIDVTSNQVVVSGTRAIINPSVDLVANTGYYVQVDAGALTDNFNNNFVGIADATTWNFTTFDGDEPPVVNVPIADVVVNENAANQVINLANAFNDVDNDNALITYSLVSNDNTTVVGSNLTDSNLTLSFVGDKIGIAQITVRATSNGKTVDDTFNVIVNSSATAIFTQSNSFNSGWPEGNYNNVSVRNVDDFVVPGGQTWDITTLTTQAFALGSAQLNLQNINVVFYNDNNSAPGTIVEEQTILTNQGQIIGGSTDNESITVRLNNTVNLVSGTYWVSIYPTFNVNFDSSIVRYFWSITGESGNSYREFGDGVFEALDQEFKYTVNGTVNILDAAPEVANPIADIALTQVPNPNPMVLDLSSTFTDSDNDDSAITIEVLTNTNTSVVTPSINGQNLSLDFSGTFGASTITLRATSNGLTVEDSFNVELLSSLYSQTGSFEAVTPSQVFPDFSNFALESADNFVVPANEVWDIYRVGVVGSSGNDNIQQGFFKIYNDNNGIPGNEVFNSGNLTLEPTNDSTDFNLTLTSPVSLSSGTYWISVQVVQNFNNSSSNQWFWRYTAPSVNGDYVIQDAGQLLSSWPDTWAASGNDGALIFSLFGENKSSLSTPEFDSSALKLLSNPTRGLFEIQLGNSLDSKLNVDVYDVAGRSVLKETISDVNQLSFSIDIRNKPSGIYIMRVSNSSKSSIFKLIKE